MTLASPIRSILPYFGGKRTLAPRIVAEFGPHAAYCEICCGSLAPLMAKKPAAMEIANDLYGHVINLARVMVSDRWEELCGRLARTLMHDDVFLEAKANAADEDLSIDMVPADSTTSIEDAHVDAAFWFFILSWMGRNGAAGTRGYNQTISTRYTSNGGSGGLRWCQAVDSIPAWRDRLRFVQFKRMDCVAMAERIDDSNEWVIYADPPYLRKGSKYVHDFEAKDHARLAEALGAKRRARVLVSYYDEPELEELYPPNRWTKVSLPMNKGLVNAGARRSGEIVMAPEVLLINGPSLAAGGLFQ